jgi:hypothetical protein
MLTARMTRGRKKVFLVNDTYLDNRHFGCEMVSATFREQFARTGLELTGSATKHLDPARHAAKLDAADLVVINGEGTLHHNRSRNLLELAARYPSVLVNAVFEDNAETAHLLKDFRLIACRESLSARYVGSLGFPAEVCPDVIFASAFIRAFSPEPPQHDLGLTDSVRWRRSRLGPIRLKRKFGFPAECGIVDYLKTFTSYRRLCIGRFHGVALASMLGIPFSSWESNTWKTRGLMRDMGAEHLHFTTQQEAIAHVPRDFPESIRQFAAAAPGRIEALFDRIANLADHC